MKRNIFVFALILSIITFNYAVVYGDVAYQNADSLAQIRENREIKISGKIDITDIATPATEVPKFLSLSGLPHPFNDSIPEYILDQVTLRNKSLSKDSLCSADLIWVLRPYLQWLQNIDPHFRVEPQPVHFSDVKKADDISVFGFLSLNVNDTLIVDRSIDPLFQQGDRILRINDVPASQYLQYCYDDRHIYPFTLLSNYHYAIITAFDYKIRLARKGNILEINTSGFPWKDVYLKLNRQREFQSRIFKDAKTGYFSIGEFYPNNNLLIRKLRTAVLQARREGCTSFILDLRGNPGGNGHSFDRLLSIFINRPTIPYLKNERLKVSPWTLNDYDFLTSDMLGSVVEVPSQHMNKTIYLDQQLYIPGMQYYVLMDKDTSSIAASFCNILQYNGAVQLVGEPLRHNALKYGETVDARFGISGLYLYVSTVEFDEYTRAVDGVLMPDIAIPYVARDYLSGRDAMLDKLLEIIESNPIN